MQLKLQVRDSKEWKTLNVRSADPLDAGKTALELAILKAEWQASGTIDQTAAWRILRVEK